MYITELPGKFIEIGSAGVKYFSTETVSIAKCETL